MNTAPQPAGPSARTRRPRDGTALRARLAVTCLLLAGAPASRDARAAAEIEVVEVSVGESTSAPPAVGYFVADDPTLFLLSTTPDPLGPHDDHEDSLFTHRAIYRADDRVNSARRFNVHAIPVGGSAGPGHSFAIASGFADAGSDELGGGDLGAYAEASTGPEGRAPATGASDTEIRYRVTIDAGTSGLAPGSPIEGLRWEFGAHGSLEVAGRTHPARSAASVGALFSATISRQAGAVCGPGPILCPHGAVAAKATLSVGASLSELVPQNPGDPTGRITTQHNWSAMRNTGNLHAGEVFLSGNRQNPDAGGIIVAQDQEFGSAFSFDTGDAPLALDGIDFNATVGERLTLEARLGITAGVSGGEGSGTRHARADFFHTVRNRVLDPQQRGVAIVFEFEPLPTTTTTSTTTPSVSSTTLPGCASAGDCDDDNPCTVDACDPAAGCASHPAGAQDLAHQVPACGAEHVPPAVGRKLAQGCARAGAALAAGSPKAGRRQFARAVRAFAQGAKGAVRARRHLTADCATALRGFFADSRAWVVRLRHATAHAAPPR